MEADLPEGPPPGEVQITIRLPDEVPLTDEEVAELLRPVPSKSGAEIAAALDEYDLTEWADVGDGAEWVEKQKAKRQAHRQW